MCHSRGIVTAFHLLVSRSASRSSDRTCGDELEPALIAAAAGSQSPTATTATTGTRSCTSAARATEPNVSAHGSAVAGPTVRDATGWPPLRSAARTSGGRATEKMKIASGASAWKAKPPTPVVPRLGRETRVREHRQHARVTCARWGAVPSGDALVCLEQRHGQVEQRQKLHLP